MRAIILYPLFFCFLLSGSGCMLDSSGSSDTVERDLDTGKIREKAKEALQYCRQHKMDTTCCILIDMSIHSGKSRLVIYDQQQQQQAISGLVSHGCGSNAWGKDHSRTEPEFSNEDGSHCSTQGKYRIGERGSSQWGIGIKYLLNGLETSNNNALKRAVVLHSWHAVPDEEIFPDGVPEGWGCAAVSDKMMRYIDQMLQSKKQPVLLWIFI